MSSRSIVIPVLLAGIIGTLGCVAILLGDAGWTVAVGLTCHGLAAFVSVRAAAVRRTQGLSQVEWDAVLWTAILIPFWGPALAWALPRRDRGEKVENAHEMMERYAAHVQPRIPDWERTLFTGDHDRDLARELDAESFREVLTYGDTDQKRNALRGLADLGEPHHLGQIRDCLVDDDGEVRLYAYGELERLTKRHESKIADARARINADASDGSARLALARANHDLAASGILDPSTAAFHFRAATRTAKEAAPLLPDTIEPILLEVQSMARVEDFDGAAERLGAVPEQELQRPEVCLVRAQLAFARRDFDACREEAVSLRQADAAVPPWLAALEPLVSFDLMDETDSFLASAADFETDTQVHDDDTQAPSLDAEPTGDPT